MFHIELIHTDWRQFHKMFSTILCMKHRFIIRDFPCVAVSLKNFEIWSTWNSGFSDSEKFGMYHSKKKKFLVVEIKVQLVVRGSAILSQVKCSSLNTAFVCGSIHVWILKREDKKEIHTSFQWKAQRAFQKRMCYHQSHLEVREQCTKRRQLTSFWEHRSQGWS